MVLLILPLFYLSQLQVTPSPFPLPTRGEGRERGKRKFLYYQIINPYSL